MLPLRFRFDASHFKAEVRTHLTLRPKRIGIATSKIANTTEKTMPIGVCSASVMCQSLVSLRVKFAQIAMAVRKPNAMLQRLAMRICSASEPCELCPRFAFALGFVSLGKTNKYAVKSKTATQRYTE